MKTNVLAIAISAFGLAGTAMAKDHNTIRFTDTSTQWLKDPVTSTVLKEVVSVQKETITQTVVPVATVTKTVVATQF